MVYIMKFKVDGGCRRNGQPNAIGAAAAVLFDRNQTDIMTWTRALRSPPRATNHRAEITAIIIALEEALNCYRHLNSTPHLQLTIKSDSRFAVDCMNEWIYKWTRNGWTNFSGNEVANRDLLEEASDLDDKVKELGEVKYVYICRSENTLADQACNEIMDELESR